MTARRPRRRPATWSPAAAGPAVPIPATGHRRAGGVGSRGRRGMPGTGPPSGGNRIRDGDVSDGRVPVPRFFTVQLRGQRVECVTDLTDVRGDGDGEDARSGESHDRAAAAD